MNPPIHDWTRHKLDDPGVIWVVLAIAATIIAMRYLSPPRDPERDDEDLDKL